MKSGFSTSLKVARQALIGAAIAATASPVLAQENGEEGNFARGAKAWQENCSRCHRVRDPAELRDDQWVPNVYHMRIRGGLTGQETRDIIKFLQQSN